MVVRGAVLHGDSSRGAGAEIGHEAVLLEDAEGGAGLGGDHDEDAAACGEVLLQVLCEGDAGELWK